MAGLEHEGLIGAFTDDPFLAPELLTEVFGLELNIAGCRPRLESENMTDVTPSHRTADEVLAYYAPGAALPELAIIVEVQRCTDKTRAAAWLMYLASTISVLMCPVMLLVLCTDRAMARHWRRPMTYGHPGLVLTPLVVGPNELPRVDDTQKAMARPIRAIVSAIVHGDDDQHRKAIYTALMAALEVLPPDRAKHYTDVVYVAGTDTARIDLEEALMSGPYKYRGEFAQTVFAEGEAEGMVASRAESILDILSARKIEVSEDVRTRITSCTDLAQLRDWTTRAVTVTSADALFG